MTNDRSSELLEHVEVPSAHYLVENKIWQAPHTCPLQRVDFGASHRPPCKAKPKSLISFHHPL
jgi:hypothetical protein